MKINEKNELLKMLRKFKIEPKRQARTESFRKELQFTSFSDLFFWFPLSKSPEWHVQ